MHVFKQVIGILASPLVWAYLFCAAAVVCRSLKRSRIAIYLFFLAAAVGYLGSTSVVGAALLQPLESRYPPLRSDQPLPKIGYIVVLGSGYVPHDGVPVTAALTQDGLVRIVEAVRLMRLTGSARLLVSGGAPTGLAASAIGYAKLARDLGIPAESLIVQDQALDTESEAVAISRSVGQATFLLVTSSFHMPRAMSLLVHAGAHPIPAPTEQFAGPNVPENWRRWLPSAAGLGASERALHEYLGLVALRLRPAHES